MSTKEGAPLTGTMVPGQYTSIGTLMPSKTVLSFAPFTVCPLYIEEIPPYVALSLINMIIVFCAIPEFLTLVTSLPIVLSMYATILGKYFLSSLPSSSVAGFQEANSGSSGVGTHGF